MSARTERSADVTRQGPYICPLAADHPYSGARTAVIKQLYLVNHKSFRLQIHFLTATGCLICPFPIYLTGRKLRWHLLDASFETLKGRLYQLSRDVIHRITCVYLGLKIVGWSGSAELYCRDVFLYPALQLLYQLCGSAGYYNHHS